MARGVPVACSDLPVLREVAGDAAVYLDPGEPATIAARSPPRSATPTGSARRAGRGAALLVGRGGTRDGGGLRARRREVRACGTVGCVVLLFAFISPRLALVATWLCTDLRGAHVRLWLVPIAGFFLLPWTTLAYGWMSDSRRAVEGLEWFLVGIAFIVDVGAYARGAAATRRRVAAGAAALARSR